MTKPISEKEVIEAYKEAKSINKVAKKFHRDFKTIKKILEKNNIKLEKHSGRPKIKLDYDLIEKLASIMCTQQEIASVLDCSTDTLVRDSKFSEIYKKGQDKGKMSLRRYQWEQARKNTTMAIWLGKQYLGQRDNLDLDNNTTVENLDEIFSKFAIGDKEDAGR